MRIIICMLLSINVLSLLKDEYRINFKISQKISKIYVKKNSVQKLRHLCSEQSNSLNSATAHAHNASRKSGLP
jgi:hypothetical protein